MLRGTAPAADLGYGLAASAVADIARRPKPGGLAPLLARLSAGEEFDSALEAATGLSPDRFEESWQQGLRRRYSVLTWLVAGGMWAVIAMGLGGLLWYRRRRDRPRRAALDQGWVVQTETASSGGDVAEPGARSVDRGGPTQ
jgi:hypothetical protein